jgi:hypothetical protein
VICRPDVRPIAPLLGLYAVASACSPVTAQRVVRERAAADLPCGAEQVLVTYISGASYRAQGCAKEAIYSCVGEGSRTRCTQEQALAPAEPASAAPVPTQTASTQPASARAPGQASTPQPLLPKR